MISTIPIDVQKDPFFAKAINYGLKKGREEGLEKGLEEGRKETIIKLYVELKWNVKQISDFMNIEPRIVIDILQEKKLLK